MTAVWVYVAVYVAVCVAVSVAVCVAVSVAECDVTWDDGRLCQSHIDTGMSHDFPKSVAVCAAAHYITAQHSVTQRNTLRHTATH